MLKTIFIAILPILALFGIGSDQSLTKPDQKGGDGTTGTLEKMIVANGSVTMDLDLNRLTSNGKGTRNTQLRFDAESNSFFTILVFNKELRGPLPGTMALIPQGVTPLPGRLNASLQQLVIENMPYGEPYDLVIRDAKTGYTFFNIEGQQLAFDAKENVLSLQGGRILLSKEFAGELGRGVDSTTTVGTLNMNAKMRAIEVVEMVNGEAKSDSLPAAGSPEAGTVPGPDVVVGDLSGLAQFNGSSGTRVGLAVGTDSCNFGAQPLHWFALPDNDHPVIPQNMYRMSGGAANDERFEQIGQSSVKHGFTALQNNICSLGCVTNPNGTQLGSGCSDPYTAGLNAGPALGSRAWINPFTGAYPVGTTDPNNHTGHTHTGPAHKILVEISDLSTSANPGATYYAEAQYITPHEYTWCQTHPGECNMNNNVSYRRYNVTGTASPFSFSAAAATVRQKAAITAWTGATLVEVRPDSAADGVAFLGYKVTNPSAGVWHYEYALYNQNMDRGIQAFSVPVGSGVTVSNAGFHAPPQQPGWTFDNTAGNAGYSSTPWTPVTAGGIMTWSSETLAQNANANAIRWGTLYNFRFDSNRPPAAMNATIGFYKTGSPMTVAIQGPSPVAAATNLTVTGRVLTSTGIPIRNATVVMNDNNGNIRYAFSSTLGYYTFENVTGNISYTLSVSMKRYDFTPVNVLVNNNLADVNIVADPQAGRARK
jgi:hypothetical protein